MHAHTAQNVAIFLCADDAEEYKKKCARYGDIDTEFNKNDAIAFSNADGEINNNNNNRRRQFAILLACSLFICARARWREPSAKIIIYCHPHAYDPK